MPKTPIRGHAARTVTIQVPPGKVDCRQLMRIMQPASDKARLRGSRDDDILDLRVLPHRDPLIRRLFSRDDIGAERLVSRMAVAYAAQNLTPDRLKNLGSPGQRAVLVLQNASGRELDRDIKVGQLRNAVALLAGIRKKRSFIGSPMKSHSARLAQNGATALTSADNVRRVQLNRFCMDVAASANLVILLASTDDKPGSVAASLSIFRAAAQSFILEVMLGGKAAPQDAIARQIRKGMDSQLLRLFIARWRRAAAAGKLSGSVFGWFDAVDWLVVAMHGARPTSPGAARAPRSPRVASPLTVALRRAATAAPVPRPAVGRSPGRASTPGTPVQDRRLKSLVLATPQPGRQGASLRMRNQLSSPVFVGDTPTPPIKVGRTVSGHSSQPREAMPAPGLGRSASSAPLSEADRLAPTATLLDVLLQEFLASQGCATTESSDADNPAPTYTGDLPAHDSQ